MCGCAGLCVPVFRAVPAPFLLNDCIHHVGEAGWLIYSASPIDLCQDVVTFVCHFQVMQHLTAVKGIGPWSVHMFMMFSLQRQALTALTALMHCALFVCSVLTAVL